MTIRSRGAPQPLCVTPSEAAQLLSVGRTKMYTLLKCGEIPSIRVGRKILIPIKELEAWLCKQLGQPPDGGDVHVEKTTAQSP